MRKRPWSILMMALVCGGAAAYLALAYLEAQIATAQDNGPAAAQMVVAARNVPSGAVLSREDLAVVKWPDATLPSGYVSSIDEVLGHGVLSPLRANEPVLSSKLAGKGAGGLPILIPAGMRAVSVKVDEVVAVAGFVVPGTRVDVLVTLPAGEGREQPATRMILQNVQVLAAGQSYQTDGEAKPQTVSVITLLVRPEEAEVLTLAATEGKVQLALRSTTDASVSDTPGAWVNALAQPRRETAPAPQTRVRAPARRYSDAIEIFHGSSRSVALF